MNITKQQLIIIGSIVGGIIVILAIIGFMSQNNSDTTSVDENGYKDPGSGEIIRSDKSPQGTEDANKNAVIYPGFSKLLDRGLSTVQIQSIQSAIIAYSLQKNEKFKEVSLDISSMGHILPTDAANYHSVYFTVKINRQTNYYIDTQYTDSNTITTKIYKDDMKTLLFTQ